MASGTRLVFPWNNEKDQKRERKYVKLLFLHRGKHVTSCEELGDIAHLLGALVTLPEDSEHPQSSSQPTVTLVPWPLVPLSGLHTCAQICLQVKHLYT